MSYFNPSRLRKLRDAKGLSLTDVYRATGVSRAQLSKIENGRADPRISTVTQLLTYYGATLGDVDSATAMDISMTEVTRRARRAAERLKRVGLGLSVPGDRLARKESFGVDTRAEREALDTRP